MSYFSNFPNIFYRNAAAKDITARPFIKTKVLNNTSLFYPYEIKEAERADITSEKIYQTPFYDWMVYLTNNITDPYNEWYMSQYDFNNFIVKKYGTVEFAQEQIKFYRVNWISDDSSKTPAAYEQLPSKLKKYWNAVYDENTGRLLSYVRRQIDVTQTTNRIIELSISNVNGSGFQVYEKVQQSSNIYGFVVHQTNTSLTIKNVSGSFVNGGTITGKITNTTARCDDASIIDITIDNDEAVYWDPVSFYAYEEEQNEKRRSINLLVPRYSQKAKTELKSLMNI